MPFRQQRAVALADAVADGRLDEADVDRSVVRIVATLLRYADVVARAPDRSIVNCAPHRALAREVAAASTVMLRNEGLAPAGGSGWRSGALVVVGRLAAVANLGDGGSSDVKSTTVVTPLDGLQAAFPDSAVTHLVDMSGDGDRALVADADLVVVVAGYTKRDEGEYIDNAGTMALAGDLFPPMDHPELGFPPRPDDAPDEAPDAESDRSTQVVGRRRRRHRWDGTGRGPRVAAALRCRRGDDRCSRIGERSGGRGRCSAGRP